MNTLTRNHADIRGTDMLQQPRTTEPGRITPMHAAHDFLVQNYRPDLLETATPELALCLIDFP